MAASSGLGSNILSQVGGALSGALNSLNGLFGVGGGMTTPEVGDLTQTPGGIGDGALDLTASGTPDLTLGDASSIMKDPTKNLTNSTIAGDVSGKTGAGSGLGLKDLTDAFGAYLKYDSYKTNKKMEKNKLRNVNIANQNSRERTKKVNAKLSDNPDYVTSGKDYEQYS